MDQDSKNGSRPTPDASNMKSLAFKLEEALAAEQESKPNLLLTQEDRNAWEVTIASRDGAVHILRFLRIWFDLPSSVFFQAVLNLDQFLARMKVQERYLKCLTVSCFYVAASNEGYNLDQHQLVTISQSKCSVKDMLRMSDIIKQKLKLDAPENRIATPADFLEVYLELLEVLNSVWDVHVNFVYDMLNKEKLLTRLEVLMSDKTCAFHRPCMLALVLVQIEIERYLRMNLPESSVTFLQKMLQVFALIGEIQLTCQIKPSQMLNCYNSVASTLQEYDNQEKAKHSQNLLWRFSSSTHALCSKYRTNRSSHMLYTIEEQLPVTYH